MKFTTLYWWSESYFSRIIQYETVLSWCSCQLRIFKVIYVCPSTGYTHKPLLSMSYKCYLFIDCTIFHSFQVLRATLPWAWKGRWENTMTRKKGETEWREGGETVGRRDTWFWGAVSPWLVLPSACLPPPSYSICAMVTCAPLTTRRWMLLSCRMSA